MLARCVRASCITGHGCKALARQHTRGRCSQDVAPTLLQFFVDRCYIAPGQTNVELWGRGLSCSYGPLGTELRRNVLEQWWHSVTRSGAQVFGINTLSTWQNTASDGGGHLRIGQSANIQQILEQRDVSNEQRTQMFLERSTSVRANLLQGTLLHTFRLLTGSGYSTSTQVPYCVHFVH